MIEDINLNYITISRVGRLVELMGDAKVGIDKDEMIDEFEKDITRIQLSSKRRRDNMTPQKFGSVFFQGAIIITRKLPAIQSLRRSRTTKPPPETSTHAFRLHLHKI